jgi:hypothetical protein
MGEDFEKLLELAQQAKTATFEVERLRQRVINELESDSELSVRPQLMHTALECLEQRGDLNERVRQAAIDFVQRTGIGDYAVAFNDVCEDTQQDLYIELPESAVCQTSTEDQIHNIRAYGLYYARRRLSELWTSPTVSPRRVASLLTDYTADFKKARASDERVSQILDEMLAYGYLEELCQVGKASRTRSACQAISEARKVVSAEQDLARSMGEGEYSLVSFLTDHLGEHKTLCLREYNKKEQARKRADLMRLEEQKNEDRDEYGQVQRRKTLAPALPPSTDPNTSDLTVLKRPYWLYCEKGAVHYWVGDRAYHGFILSYTSETARKLRFNDDRTWVRADLDIAHGRLQEFKWHSPVENFIEVQQAAGATPARPVTRSRQTPAAKETPIATADTTAEQQETTSVEQRRDTGMPPTSLDLTAPAGEQVGPPTPEQVAPPATESPSPSSATPIEAPTATIELALPPTPEHAETQPVERRVGYTLESIADRLRQEQDTVMRASPIGITLIAGAAGSGKTNVAFHRIDYLLQEHSDRFSQRNMAVFAPKTSLAKYLRELAGSLQFWSLPVYSYDSWAVGILSSFTDANGIAAEEGPELSQRKSSAAMVDLMRRYLSDKVYELETAIKCDSRLQEYAETIDGTFEQPQTSLIGLYRSLRDAVWSAIEARHELDGSTLGASRPSVESSLTRVLDAYQNQLPLVDDLADVLIQAFRTFPGFKKEYVAVKAKLEVYRQPPSWLQRQIWARGASERRVAIESILTEFLDLMFSEKRIQQLVARRVRSEKNRVNARLRATFRRICFVSIYPHPPTQLADVCETPFLIHIFPMLTEFYRSRPVWEHLGLTETPEHPFEVFQLTRADVDIAIWLLYHISSDNLAQEPTAAFLHVYDHVVVDEAQDFTPLQLLLLHRLSRNSMTLAGDLTQRIFATGIRDWSELGEPIDNQFVLTMSHRTTLETAVFASALVQAESSATLATRVAHHGDRPLVIQCPDSTSAVTGAIGYIQEIKDSHREASILLVHPRNSALRGLRDALAAIGITGYVAKGDTWEFSEKVTVTTYRRVQGLEYDYVVILGLDEFESMPTSGNRSRILYTLATRAKQQVIFSIGGPLPTLLRAVDSSLYDVQQHLDVKRS